MGTQVHIRHYLCPLRVCWCQARPPGTVLSLLPQTSAHQAEHCQTIREVAETFVVQQNLFVFRTCGISVLSEGGCEVEEAGLWS